MRSAGSSPFSPPSTASPNEERLSLGPAGVGLRELGRGPGSSSGGGGGSGKCCCPSGGGGRPGSAPAGPEPQEGERAEEGEEEGKKEEEERSSQQARGGRTSWCGGCQQPRKREAVRPNQKELSGEETHWCHAGGDWRDPLAPTTEVAPPAGPGGRAAPPASAPRHLGLRRPRLGSTKEAGAPSFPERKLSTEMPRGVRCGPRRGPGRL